MAEKVELTHGPIPAQHFELGLRWFQDAPDTERFFAVALGRGRLSAGGAPAGRDRNETRVSAPAGACRRVPSHGSSRAFFSATDDRDEQGVKGGGKVDHRDGLTA